MRSEKRADVCAPLIYASEGTSGPTASGKGADVSGMARALAGSDPSHGWSVSKGPAWPATASGFRCLALVGGLGGCQQLNALMSSALHNHARRASEVHHAARGGGGEGRGASAVGSSTGVGQRAWWRRFLCEEPHADSSGVGRVCLRLQLVQHGVEGGQLRRALTITTRRACT